MKREKVKGLVMETSKDNMVLLTREGEYVKVSGKGHSCSPGMEIEVEVPTRKKLFPLLPAAGMVAALLIFLVFSLVQPAGATPEAYLALDINPSILFPLDKNARVTEAEGFNEEGERILARLELEEAGVLEALEAILEAAHEDNYLSKEKINHIILSLAASENFPLGEEELRDYLSKKLLDMELDAYLKINVAGIDKAKKAKEMNVPLNAFLLGEQMRERAEEGTLPFEESPPLPVREFLETVEPADIFQEEEFVPGEKGKEKRKPDVPPIPKIPPERKDGGVEEEEKAPSDKGEEISPDLDQKKTPEDPEPPVDTPVPPAEDKIPDGAREGPPGP